MITIVKPDTHWDILGKRKIAAALSCTVLAISLAVVFFSGGLKYGIDFAGGIEMQVQFKETVDIAKLRRTLAGIKIGDFSVQTYGEETDFEYLLRVMQPEDMGIKKVVELVDEALNESFGGPESYTVRRQEFVGPRAGKELREKGVMAILFSLVGILIYVALRFEFGYALGAVAALFHDVLIVVGFFVLVGNEFNLQTVAALLTIVGYSLNDTIVVFDRIREMTGRKKRALLQNTMNEAINNTLSRTILTSLTTMLTVLALYFFSAHGSVIENFAQALIAGIIVGTYSSVFVASPVVLFYQNLRKKSK